MFYRILILVSSFVLSCAPVLFRVHSFSVSLRNHTLPQSSRWPHPLPFTNHSLLQNAHTTSEGMSLAQPQGSGLFRPVFVRRMHGCNTSSPSCPKAFQTWI